MLRLLLATTLVSATVASYCGDSAIPYSFEALADGQPVLGCARPSCFGWNPDGLPVSNTANFYRINARPDGFFRKDRSSVPPFQKGDIRYYQQQTAICDESYQSTNCNTEDQWVSGIAPLLNVTQHPTVLQCCTYEPLRLSTDRGIASVNAGQIVVGGEVTRHGRQYAFDYISDLSKTINKDGTVTYDVSIRRFPCAAVKENGPSKKPEFAAARAFQAPTAELGQAIDTNVIQTPQGPQGPQGPQVSQQGPGEDVLVEDIIAQPGVIQQQIPQAPPPQTPPFQQQFVQGNSYQQMPPPQLPPSPGYAVPAPSQGGYQVAQPAYAVPDTYVAPQPPVQQPVAQPQPVYYPPAAAPAPAYYYGGGGSGGGSYYCFTADTIVRALYAGEKRMDELKVNDWVQSINETGTIYAPVLFWLHKMPSQKAEFVKIELEDGSSLKLTGKHFIFKADCDADEQKVKVSDINREAVFAETVQEGDCLYRVHGEQNVVSTRVSKVSTVEEVGIYAPMTANGKVVVNGILASCHNIIQSHTLQNTFFSYVDRFNALCSRFFGKSVDSRELPMGMDLFVQMVDYIIPKNIVTM